jgi:hypothetical protein
MPVAKSAQDRMIEYFVGAELSEAQETLKTAAVIVRVRQARRKLGEGGATAPATPKRGRPRKVGMPSGAMPPLGAVGEKSA